MFIRYSWLIIILLYSIDIGYFHHCRKYYSTYTSRNLISLWAVLFCSAYIYHRTNKQKSITLPLSLFTSVGYLYTKGITLSFSNLPFFFLIEWGLKIKVYLKLRKIYSLTTKAFSCIIELVMLIWLNELFSTIAKTRRNMINIWFLGFRNPLSFFLGHPQSLVSKKKVIKR